MQSDTPETYAPQSLNPEAQKRLMASMAQLDHNPDEQTQKKRSSTRRRPAKKAEPRALVGDEDYYEEEEEEEEDDVEHVKRVSKKLFKGIFWLFLFLLGVTGFAVLTGVSHELVKAYHNALYNREAASATLRNECCRYWDNTLPPERELEVESDCKLMTDGMCRAAKVTIGEFMVVQVVRQLAYAYSLCSEGTCYQSIMNITFSGGGLLFGTYKALSTVMWFLNPGNIYRGG